MRVQGLRSHFTAASRAIPATKDRIHRRCNSETTPTRSSDGLCAARVLTPQPYLLDSAEGVDVKYGR